MAGHGEKPVTYALRLRDALFQFVVQSRKLAALNLSGTTTVELTSSIIGRMKHLRFLALNNTKTESLPIPTDCSDSSEELEDDSDKEIVNQVQNLQPNTSLFELAIQNYPGNLFPIWIQDSSLGMLVSITIDDCQNCNEIPYLGDLPSLKYLFIQKMYVVESFGQRSNSLTTDGRCTESVGDVLFAILEWNKQGGFPTASLSLSTNDTAAQVLQYLRPNSNLEELIMKGYNGSSFPSWVGSLPLDRDMGALEEWSEFKDEHFPQLKYLSIVRCAKLKVLPNFTSGPKQRIRSCEKLLQPLCQCLQDNIQPSLLTIPSKVPLYSGHGNVVEKCRFFMWLVVHNCCWIVLADEFCHTRIIVLIVTNRTKQLITCLQTVSSRDNFGTPSYSGLA
uniref:R13L1/DRL21-like LRR repeat region domain-containing protein n=1 Tax=Oryza barthii TaxID=65489 RepID=A0A0D3GPI5_9ORYZ